MGGDTENVVRLDSARDAPRRHFPGWQRRVLAFSPDWTSTRGANTSAPTPSVGFYAWWTGRAAGVVPRIDASGVWFRDWGVTVPWPEIGEILHTGNRLQPFVSLRIRDPDRFPGSPPPGETRKLKRGRLWKSPCFRIPDGSVDAPRPELLAVLRAAPREYG